MAQKPQQPSRAVMPPGSEGCSGVLIDGPSAVIGRVNALCQGCRRYQDRKHTARRMAPALIARRGGTPYCSKFLAA